MGLGDADAEIEIYREPDFRPGTRVRAKKLVKNDGTVGGREIGEILVKKGDEGYVRDVGTYLQRHYVYAVEFLTSGNIVGMLGRELVSAETAERKERAP
ncbi:nitrogen fixation protein NifZ [Afifella sp. IM 167]|uniref:nitrogen fixation protein NifZ n=1 Tax=Afifella sp. IM 167 TaxID=2033586 RepID=UPI001CCD2970|nr:nitrogen fixation protein NifZ [Afifella sp. IM 167]MBZ8135256.1 nitrogen fixation protein NifZ [Afifella sp. IM 167]